MDEEETTRGDDDKKGVIKLWSTRGVLWLQSIAIWADDESILSSMRERGEGREFIFVSKLPFGVKSENKQQQQEHTERERESEHRERERESHEWEFSFLLGDDDKTLR